MSLHRILPLTLLCLSTTGCAVMYELLVPAQTRHSQESARVKELTGEAWKAKDCAAGVAKLNSVADKARVRPAVGNYLTPYGEEVKRWWMFCLKEAGAAAREREGDPVAHFERSLALMDLALSLPVSQVGLEDKHPKDDDSIAKASELSVARATTLRQAYAAELGKLQGARAAQKAEADRRVALAQAAEQKGWHLAALAAWQAVAPIDDAGRAQRDEALVRVGALARAQLAVKVALQPAGSSGAPPEVLAAVRAHPALQGRPELTLVEDPAAATVVMRLGLGAISKDQKQETVRQQHTWVSGRTTVPNPQLESIRKQIAYHDKETIYWRKSAASIRCTGGGVCKSRISALNNVKREEEHAARERQRLAKEKPTVTREVSSVHEFNASRTVVTASCPVTATPALKGAASAPLEGAARVERAGLTWPAEPKVGLAARADALPASSELESLVREAAARELAARVATAPALAAAEFDGPLAAASEPLEKLHYAALKALRSGQPADLEAARTTATAALGSAPDWTALQAALKRQLATR